MSVPFKAHRDLLGFFVFGFCFLFLKKACISISVAIPPWSEVPNRMQSGHSRIMSVCVLFSD